MRKGFFAVVSTLVVLLLMGLSSCSDPAKDQLFKGTYHGLIAFGSLEDGIDVRSNDQGSVTVTKIGDRYSFKFSDDIPALKNIELEVRDDQSAATYREGLNSITVTQDKLNIFYNKDGKNWTATCVRETDKNK